MNDANSGVAHRPGHRDAADRVGPVEHDDRDARLLRRLEDQAERADVGVERAPMSWMS